VPAAFIGEKTAGKLVSFVFFDIPDPLTRKPLSQRDGGSGGGHGDNASPSDHPAGH
jgi:hypothetical protein